MTLRAGLTACLLVLAAGTVIHVVSEMRRQGKIERRDRLASSVPKESLPAIRLHSEADVAAMRRELARLVWKADAVPAGWPNLQEQHEASLMDKLPPARVMQVRLPLGMDSRIYYLTQASSDCLVVFHEGHRVAFVAPVILGDIWKAGCSILYINMPLNGGNAVPTIEHPHLGKFRLHSHNLLQLVDLGNFTILQVFLEPVVEALNKVLSEGQFGTVIMVGFSGGGWTTALYSAIDPRIKASVHVAGSMPLFLLSLPPFSEVGDIEQYYPPLLAVADYLELYVMGADRGRAQLQILNRYDPCCFAGEASKVYAPLVQKASQALGGRWDQWLDDTHAAHQISPAAVDKVIDFIRVAQSR
jgi:hypothetical protein